MFWFYTPFACLSVGITEHTPLHQNLVTIMVYCKMFECELFQLAQSIAEGAEEATGDDAHRDDVTALMVAAQGGHLEVTQLLVEHGSDVRAKDEEGFTPLLYSVKVSRDRVDCFCAVRGEYYHMTLQIGLHHLICSLTISFCHEGLAAPLIHKRVTSSSRCVTPSSISRERR